ncbi:hypothetical protein NDU88_006695 [Pleurodeles waltl]|uniref:Uncharacterized protein n=1 Tax=Pleurodeles waltl TaxID=8319 RepID=A0AAV7MGH4_PLEWA|nr:hypothetical protein NDU88_006695 [Pleurodeles waltl]
MREREKPSPGMKEEAQRAADWLARARAQSLAPCVIGLGAAECCEGASLWIARRGVQDRRFTRGAKASAAGDEGRTTGDSRGAPLLARGEGHATRDTRGAPKLTRGEEHTTGVKTSARGTGLWLHEGLKTSARRSGLGMYDGEGHRTGHARGRGAQDWPCTRTPLARARGTGLGMHKGAATASASEGHLSGHVRGRGAQDCACTRAPPPLARARGTGLGMHEGEGHRTGHARGRGALDWACTRARGTGPAMHEGAATASASEGHLTGHARGRGAQDCACTRAPPPLARARGT